MSILYLTSITIAFALCKAIRDGIAIDLFKAYQQSGNDAGSINDTANSINQLQRQWHVMGWFLGATAVIGYVMGACSVNLVTASIPTTLFYLAFVYWVMHDLFMNMVRELPLNHLGNNTLDKFLKTLSIHPVLAKTIPGTIFLIITLWQNY